MVSPPLAYQGGSASLTFQYWTDLDPDEAYSLDYEVVSPTGCTIIGGGHMGIGGSWSSPLTEVRTIPASRFAVCSNPDSVLLRVVINTNPGPSDADCEFDSQFGAAGVDNISFTGAVSASFDFENGNQGWITEVHPFGPAGVHLNVHDLAGYGQGWESWPDCPAEGNVLTLHDLEDSFSPFFDEGALSPLIDLTPLGLSTLEGAHLTLTNLEDYFQYPGIRWWVLVRSYPQICPVTGLPRWSDWYWVYSNPVGGVAECLSRDVDLLPGLVDIPERIQVALNVLVCRGCELHDTAPSNATPVFDNLKLCVEGQAAASVDASDWGRLGSSLTYRLGPNPLTPESVLHLRVSGAELPVRVTLHEASGRQVGVLTEEVLSVGEHELPVGQSVLRAGKHSGTGVPAAPQAGVYFIRIQAGELEEARKMVLVE